MNEKNIDENETHKLYYDKKGELIKCETFLNDVLIKKQVIKYDKRNYMIKNIKVFEFKKRK